MLVGEGSPGLRDHTRASLSFLPSEPGLSPRGKAGQQGRGAVHLIPKPPAGDLMLSEAEHQDPEAWP